MLTYLVMISTYPDGVSVGGGNRYGGFDDWGAHVGGADQSVPPGGSHGGGVGTTVETGGGGGDGQEGGEYDLEFYINVFMNNMLLGNITG